MPGAEALGELLSMVDMEPWWSDVVWRLYSLEDLRWCGWSGLNSTVEATGFRRTAFSLICEAGRTSWAVFGRTSSVEAVSFFVEPLELVGEKKDVSTFNLDFLRCGFAADSSALTASASGVTGNSFTGCPKDSIYSLLGETTEKRLDTDLDGSESREGLLPLEEREDLLGGMMGGGQCRACSNKRA